MARMMEKAARAAEIEMQMVEMIDAAPSVIRALQAKRVVRAVLMAVREPDTDVCFVGDQLVGDHGSNGQGVFTAMIDAILNEGAAHGQA